MRRLLSTAAAALSSLTVLAGCVAPPAGQQAASDPQRNQSDPADWGAPPAAPQDGEFPRSSVVEAVENWLGVSAQTSGEIVENVFEDLGDPVGYIYGEEASGAIGPGLRYGRGILVLSDGQQLPVFWQGPSIGWDVGGNASKTFTLVYDLGRSEDIYRRFPGVEGSAYLVGGVGVNYQRAEGITLVPMRAGVGARLGANVGYLAYSRRQRVIPF